MKQRGTFPKLAAGVVVVALLAAVAVPGGWLILVPVGLALAAAGRAWQILGR